jgi:hypothetical protein
MTANTTKAADPCFAAPLSAPLGEREFPRFVAGLGLANGVASVALFATLLVFPSARASYVTAPALSHGAGTTAQFAGTDLPPASAHVAGSGYVEFEPSPAEPLSTVGFSHASATEQARENGIPAAVPHRDAVALFQVFSFTGD